MHGPILPELAGFFSENETRYEHFRIFLKVDAAIASIQWIFEKVPSHCNHCCMESGEKISKKNPPSKLSWKSNFHNLFLGKPKKINITLQRWESWRGLEFTPSKLRVVREVCFQWSFG